VQNINRMKKITTIILINLAILITTPLFSQVKVDSSFQKSVDWSLNHYYRLFQVSSQLNDLESAKNALLNLMIEIPQNDSILFQLGTIYYQMQNYTSAAICTQQVINRNPNHVAALEINAISYENIGINDKAVESYEKLYLKTENFESIYKLIILQYDLERYNECLANIEIMLGRTEVEEYTMPVLVEGNKQKDYPIKVFILNLKGMIKKEQGDLAAAKSIFEAVLKVAPDFIAAKENLQSVSK